MSKYNHQKIEKKWQKRWDDTGIYYAVDGSTKPKAYYLVEFPYPSGAGLHVGHPRSYTAIDVMARYKRMNGFNVLFPIGWDAFGLPTENFAIKNGVHPTKVTKDNIKVFTKQIKSLGISFDWSREINTTDPSYYKWTQWIFLKLYENGLAYKKKMPINWCPSCKIGLANEEVIDGKCERCGAETERREIAQWMLKITAYADRLIEDLETVDYLEKIKTSQINWIGRSTGAEIEFKVKDFDFKIKVYTTRPDTLFGATYLVLSPEHELVNKITTKKQEAAVLKYQEEARKKSDLERTELNKEKTGVFTGAYAINPVNNVQIPIWIADYVLASYGTGAIMAVPAHDERDFEFAKKFQLPIIQVIKPNDKDLVEPMEKAFTGYGVNINSEFLNGLETVEAMQAMIKWLEDKGIGRAAKQYKLRDWVFSRQHYWGEPIPIVFCDQCGEVAVPYEQLPLELPMVKKYEPTDTGESPLAAIKDWVNTKCPKCGGPARRETDTMPNWAGSSWYFLRYIDPQNDKEFASMDKLKYWLPVDLYNGGMEHTTLHLLYSRFWHKFLFDIGAVPTPEPYKKRVSHGMILAEGGVKMSKSKGNVINPDEIVAEYGADVLRAYEMFMGPYDQAVVWDTHGIKGVRRFLERIWNFEKFIDQDDSKVLTLLHKTIKKVGEDIENMRFNTAISAMMIFMNGAEKFGLTKDSFKKFLIILAPFMPHVTEELWERLGEKDSIHLSKWPKFDVALIKDEKVKIAIQINGKVRDEVEVDKGLSSDEVKEIVIPRERVQAYIANKKIRKFIYVQDKLVSIVI